MVALARTVVVNDHTYLAGTDHTAMLAADVDEVRNPDAWVGGTPPPVSPDAPLRVPVDFADLSSVGAARRALGIPAPSATVIVPSGDTSGAVDTAAINASLLANPYTLLVAGDYYVSDLGLVRDNRRLSGVGAATVLHVLAGHTGLVVTGPGDVLVSDLTFSGGSYGIAVNGCYDGQFERLRMTGQTAGGVKVDGDLATEQHWVDVVMRNVGGVGFAINRTTSSYTGSLYMDRVRIVEPAAGATNGFKFSSTAGSPSLNIAFMHMCVADNYAGDAYVANNCGQIFASNCWFAINASAPSGAAAMRVTAGFQHSYTGCYTYSGRTDPTVVLAGATNGVTLEGHTFDGTTSTVALGLAGSTGPGFTLGSYQTYCGGGLADVPAKLAVRQPTLPGTTATHGEETFSRMFCNNAVQLATGSGVFTYFTATKTELISTVECQIADAKSGGTYCGYGLFTVADDGTLTLVAKAEQTSAPTLWNSGFQGVGGFDTKLGLSAVYQKVAGQRYAVCALFVGTTGPKLIGNLQSNGTASSSLAVSGTTLGPIGGVKTSMSTLGSIGSTIAAAGLTGTGIVPYFVLN